MCPVVGLDWAKMVLYQKLSKNVILRGLKLRRFTQNQINPHQKTSQNHRKLITSHKGNFHQKPPTHIRPTYAIQNSIKIYTKFLESDSQGIRSKFLYHQIQHHSLNQKPYLD